MGDANDDGLFNSADLVLVLQAGEYKDRDYNSTYDEGDWNGDGDFDSSDLVLAFQVGRYESRRVAGDVAAAVDGFSPTRTQRYAAGYSSRKPTFRGNDQDNRTCEMARLRDCDVDISIASSTRLMGLRDIPCDNRRFGKLL